MLASALYFSSFAGLWLIVPGVVYLWKGKQSRFLGFHAVQSVLLQFALIPVGMFGMGVAFATMAAIGFSRPRGRRRWGCSRSSSCSASR